MISQKKYFITINRFDEYLHLDIKQNFCEVTQSLCRGSESRSSTYDAPCTFISKIALFQLEIILIKRLTPCTCGFQKGQAYTYLTFFSILNWCLNWRTFFFQLAGNCPSQNTYILVNAQNFRCPVNILNSLSCFPLPPPEFQKFFKDENFAVTNKQSFTNLKCT